MKAVSNSQVTSWNTCKKQHYYAYGMKLAKRELDDAPYRGIIGHEALAVYYTTGSRELALQVVIDELVKQITLDPMDFSKHQILKDLKVLLTKYFDHYERQDYFKVLLVEHELRTPIDENIEYGMFLDLLIENRKGELWVFDHKFVYNFKSETDLQYDAQQAKYIYTCQQNGFNVKGAIFNQLRHRDVRWGPEQLFSRTPAKASVTRVQNIWKEQEDAAKEIVYREEEFVPRRVLTSAACKYCSFLRICNAELDGIDPSNIIAVDYVAKQSPLEKPNDDS